MNTSVVSPHRRVSLKAGWLYLLTFVSIPTLALYGPVKGANYVLGSGPDTAAIIGGILEITIALAGLGTAVTLFPMLKKQNESFALGLVAARVLEPGCREATTGGPDQPSSQTCSQRQGFHHHHVWGCPLNTSAPTFGP